MIGNKRQRQREDSPLQSMLQPQGLYKFMSSEDMASMSSKRVKNNTQSDLDNFAEIVNDVLNEVDLKKNPRKKDGEPLADSASLRMRYTQSTARKGYGRETKAGAKGKKTGRWTRTEHLRFIQAIIRYGIEDHLKMQEHIGTRTCRQIRSHQQKYFNKQEENLGY